MNYLFVLLLLATAARTHPDGAWKWGESADKPSTDAPAQLAVADANGKLHSDTQSSSGSVDVEEAAEAILDSSRHGKVINTYEAVYGDPSVQKALQGGNDTEARTYIKEKLCNLGLAKECSKLYGKSYGFGGGHGGLGIDPNAISYVQPVAIVPAGSPIAAIPIGHGIKHKGHIKGGYGAPPALLPGNGYGAPPVGGIGGIGPIGGLGGVSPLGLPAAPPQHIHHHTYDNGFKNKGVVGYNGGAQPLLSNNYNPPPPPPVYNNPAPVYNPQPARPVYNNPPPPPPVYNNPPPVYNQPPARPYAAASNPSYTSINSANYGSPRDQCVCVPVAQCPSYDIIGRNVDYQIDPRTKGTSNVTATEVAGDIVIVTTAEGRSLSNNNSTQRRRRQSFKRINRQSGRQTIVGDDSITVISSDAPADSFPGISPPSGGFPAASPGPVADIPISSGDNGSGSTDSISVPAADVAAPGVAGFRESRQLGGSGGFPQCSYNQVCCRAPAGGPSRYSSTAPGTCGRRNPYGINGRIKTQPYVDGEAEFGEYPWQVAILKKDQYDNVYVCGGALIGPSHVLTAAHCIKGNAPGDLRVRLGEWDVNRESEFYPHVEKDVVSVIIHPEYYPGNLYNDIALVKFEGYVDFTQNPHIAPACLPPKSLEFTGTRCWVTGWGKDAFGTGGRYQNILKEVDVPVVSHYDCENKLRRTRLGQEFNLHQGFLCAGGEEGKDACKGDGGGPLVCESQGTWFLSGLVSWGIGCGQYDTPGVYTKVSEYYDWVQKNLIY